MMIGSAALRFSSRCAARGLHPLASAAGVLPACHHRRPLHSLPDALRPRFDARLRCLAREFDELNAKIAAAATATATPGGVDGLSLATRWNQLKPLADKIADLQLLRDLAEETKRLIGSLTGGEDGSEESCEDGELVDLARLENGEREAAIRALEVEIARMLQPRRPLPSDCPVLLEVKPGVGGLEAMLFASELLQMYIAYAEYRSWRCEVVEDARAELGGLRSGVLEISDGHDTYEELKHETGAHRVQRVPQTGDVIHTSTATVFVLPKPEDLAATFQINPADVELQVHRSSGPGGQSVNKHQSAVRLIHRPTGIRVDCQSERSQHQNLELANRALRDRVLRRQLEALADEDRAARAVQGQRDRSDRIRTYNYQQGRVTDHRVRLTHPGDVGAFMTQGQHLRGFIAALRDREETAELERVLADDAATVGSQRAGAS